MRSTELRHATEPLGHPRRRELPGIAAIACSHTLSGLRAAELRRASESLGHPRPRELLGVTAIARSHTLRGRRRAAAGFCTVVLRRPRGANRRRPALGSQPAKGLRRALVTDAGSRGDPRFALRAAYAARPRMQTTGTDGRRCRATRFAAEFAWHFRSPEDSRHGMRCAA